MAARPDTMIAWEDVYSHLPDFISELRETGYAIGMEQYQWVQDLLIQLAASDNLPDDPVQWVSLIRPIVCHTPSEQSDFNTRYSVWARQFVPCQTVAKKAETTKFDFENDIQQIDKKAMRWKWKLPLLGLILFGLFFWGQQLMPALFDTHWFWKGTFLPDFSVTWLWVILPGVILIIIFGYHVLWHKTARRYLAKHTTDEAVNTSQIPVQKVPLEQFHSMGMIRTAQKFRQHMTVPSNTLDIQATIDETIQNYGLLKPVFGEQGVTPEYLALIDRTTYRDHQAHIADTLLDILDKYDVSINRYYFDQDPQICYASNDSSKDYQLAELISRHPDHRLILFSNGQGLSNPFTQEPYNWVDLLSSWDHRALMTVSRDNLTSQTIDSLLNADFLIVPASETGLNDMIGWIQKEHSLQSFPGRQSSLPPSLLESADWLFRADSPAEDRKKQLIKDLYAFLGLPGIEWLGACSIYPEIHFSLTVYLGLFLQQKAGSPLFSMHNLTSLSRLPWFRYGSMPDWLRQHLIQGMSLKQEHNIRSALDSLLITAMNPGADPFYLPIAQYQQSIVRRLIKRLVPQMGGSDDLSPFQDHIFLTFISDPLSVKIPKLLREYFKNKFADDTSLLEIPEPVEELSQKQEKIPEKGDEWVEPVTGMTFVYVPGGSFMMGSPDDEEERFVNEGPQHEVTVDGFWMGKYPVTQGEWKTIMNDNPSSFKLGDNHPVEKISWDETQEFIKHLNEQSGATFRLPTEAEWEYACRAGTQTPFYFGETIDTDQVKYDGNYPYGKGKKGKFREQTTPVGSFPPNDFGLYDMHGNVWEWCQDWYGDYSSGKEVNPAGPNAGSYRVVRGGAWNNTAEFCRSAIRLDIGPDRIVYSLGFRLALPLGHKSE